MSNKKSNADILLDATTASVKKSISAYGIMFVIAGLLVGIAAIVLSFNIWTKSISDGISAGVKSYDDTKLSVHEAQKEEQKAYTFEKTRDKYQATHNVSIVFGDVKQINNLEVLQVTEEEIITQKDFMPDNKKNIAVWYKVSGTGTFSIDLSTSEFISNDALKYVKVYCYKPEMTYEYHSGQQLAYLNGEESYLKNPFTGQPLWGNGSNQTGVEYKEMIDEVGSKKIYTLLTQNVEYAENAENTAKQIIENLIKKINNDIPDLKVEVEFY